MGFIRTIIEQHKKKVQERNNTCDELISRIDEALRETKSLFSDPQIFVKPQAETDWKNRNSGLLADIETNKIQRLKKASHYNILSLKQIELYNAARYLSQNIIQHNARTTNIRIQEAYTLIGDVEGRKLDQQQMACIVKEAHNHLVIAGAGTGKTTTVVGKIKYLLKTGKYLPQDILVLSFTNASASEMDARIAAETGQNIAASTFHKLGLNIITQVNGVMPRITQINLRKFIREQLKLNMQSDTYLSLLSSYLLYNRVVAKSEFDFKSQKEYDEYLKLNPPTTVNNETVKSYGEMDIANFLTQNSIRYIYEQPY
ncbi:MAG: UvrD-helicase domain-containing protein, partial [Eubacteriales bacterium]|nr:UvrD-helicase domain-containing protein [Eubacteriales bacterium]